MSTLVCSKYTDKTEEDINNKFPARFRIHFGQLGMLDNSTTVKLIIILHLLEKFDIIGYLLC